MKPDELKKLLQRRKEGSCSKEELSQLENWFDSTSRAGNWEWTDARKAEIKLEIRKNIGLQMHGQAEAGMLKMYFQIAASVILILSLGLYFGSNYLKNNYQYTEINAASGKTTEVLLSDGSKIILQAKSRLKFPKTFSGKNREVFLYEGEAFFEIAKDAEKPFIVTTKKVSTKVLGTAFNISFYEHQQEMSVTVVRGKVSVSSSDGNEVLLDPNQQVVINKGSGAFKKSVVNARENIGWTEGRILLNNHTMMHAAELLEARYDINIKFASPEINLIRFTATFDKTDSLTSILNDISRINQLNYTKENKEVTFRSRKDL
jgi:ferric-dicitrate binding protein FerR (iron transport regulator)